MGDPYGDITEFNNSIIIGNPYITFNGFNSQEIVRVNRELLLWHFYKGIQWKTKRPDGEPQITINYCKAFVDKGVAFLMGKGFNIKVRPDAEEITKPFLDSVWDDNNRELLGLDMAQSGAVSGNAWVKVAVEEFDQKERPDMFELYPKGRIRITVLPTYAVFPVWDAHDRDRMVRCRIIYPVLPENKEAGTPDQFNVIWYQEIITPESIEEYYDDRLVDKRPNALHEIPVVRIKNLALAGDSLGLSDITDIVSLQKELNNKATDISDIINYHAAPITVVQGAKIGNLEKGARKIWGGIPKDGKVYHLELQSDLKAAMTYLDFVKSSMFEVGHMPADGFGKNTEISNTSGVALHIKNQPLMEVTRTKQVTYGEGIKQVNRLILKYGKLIDHPDFNASSFDSLKPLDKYWSEVDFPDPLPKDELIQMQLISQKINLYLQSRVDALTELGETEAAKKLEEILAEAKKIQKELPQMTQQGQNIAKTTNIGGIVHKNDKAKEKASDD